MIQLRCLVMIVGLCWVSIVQAESYQRVLDNLHAQANYGDSKAQFTLAHAYYTSEHGLERSCEQAAYWFERASLSPVDTTANVAMYSLGKLYSDLSCEQHDDAQAAHWFDVASKRGVTAAQNNLGLMYLHGQGVPQNTAQAFRLFEAAAKQDNSAAQINLGLMYVNGNGIKKSIPDGFFWLGKAARLGDAVAQARLAVLYASNNQEMQDYVLAYMWASIAATKSGDTKFANQIAQKMTKNDLALSKKLTASCMKSSYSECDYDR